MDLETKIREKGIEFKSIVLARVCQLKEGLQAPQNWRNQNLEARELQKLEALLRSLDTLNTLTNSDEYELQLEEDLEIHHPGHDNTT